MIKLLLYLNKLSYGSNEKYLYKNKNKVLWFLCVSTYIIIRILFFYYMKLRNMLNLNPSCVGGKNENVIVSLTTFPARINNVWMVVDSICRQKMRPDSINLYLSKEEFPTKEIPSNLEKYKKLGLNIYWVEKNLKPHTKYIFAIKDNPQKYVITVDDDIYYREDLVSRLWEMSQSNYGCVCANRATKILSESLELKKYNQWGADQIEPTGVSFNYLALGTCGVLYPPGIFKDTDLFNTESIVKNCLKADDLWLKCHEVMAEIPVATGDYYCHSIEIMGSQIISLQSSNCDDTVMSGNDIQWNNLDKEYSITQKLRELVASEKN